MKFLLDELQSRQNSSESFWNLSALQRAYSCKCLRAVFFGNSHCLSCDTPLGYEPHLGQIFALTPGSKTEHWYLSTSGSFDRGSKLYRRCANFNSAAGCNWLVDPDSRVPVQYCISCRLTRTIPDLSSQENRISWGRLENAKRRVISTLIGLRLPLASRVSEDPERGLAFDFLRSPAGGPRILTGHDNGVITVNIEEADDVKREQIRASVHEPYRTLVGHLRHEIGHYYWDRLIARSHFISDFRALFGTDTADYGQALRRNYTHGPPPDWAENYVSAYASVHPWEDWAETWAHYLHMIDSVGTAMSFGLNPNAIAMPFDCFGSDVLYDANRQDSNEFLTLLNTWLKLTAVMNELCRSMGQPDFYPFALPRRAATKFQFIHTLVTDASWQSEAAQVQ
jgi:hypothetical protein